MSLNRIARLFVPSAVLFLCNLDTALGQTEPRMISSAANLAFTIQQPGVIPSAQQIQITRSTTGTPFVLNLSVTSDRGWLTASFVNNNVTTPATLDVRVTNTSGLSGGTTYSGEIQLAALGATNTPLRIPVTLTVAGTGSSFTATPTQLSFDVQTGSGSSPAQTVQLRSDTGAAIPYSLSALTDNGQPWLQAVASSLATPADLNVSVSPGTLGAGTYSGRLVITPANGLPAITITVTMRIGAQATLSVTPAAGLQFFYQTGQALPPPQNLTVAASSGTVNFNVQANSGFFGWLIAPVQGVASTTANTFSVAIGDVARGLAPGNYDGTLTFTASGISNSPVIIPVRLTVGNTPLMTVGAAPAPFNYASGGAVPPAQSVTVGTSSAATVPIPFTVATILPSGQSWLVVTPTSGNLPPATTPATLQVGLNTPGLIGLSPGTYTGRVEISAPGTANSPQSFTVTLNVTASSDLVATPSTLTFNFQTTRTSPFAQTVEVTSQTSGTRFDAAATTNSCGAGWLGVSPGAGAITPTTLQVAVNPAGITPQVCTGRINLTAQGATTSSQVPVTLNVSATPLLDVAPSAIVFTAVAGGASPASRTLVLQSTDQVTALAYSVGAGTTSGGPWLSLGGNTIGNTGAQLSVQANAQGLPAGIYDGSITVSSAAIPSSTPGILGQQIVPVRLIVTSNTTFTPTPNSLTFNMSQGGANPATQTISLASSGATALSWSASPSSLGNWLNITPVNGSTPGTLTVSVNGTGLVQSTYSGTITFLTPGAQNTTTTVPVTLVVGPPISITPSLTSLSFTYALGGAAPAAQTVNLNLAAGSTTTVNFTSSASTTPAGGTWLTVTPSSGVIPGTISVGINPANLTAGTYNGTVTITPATGSPVSIPVSLTVTQASAPIVQAVVNAANFQPGPVSPGELVVLGGTNIGPVALALAALTQQGTLSTRVADTEILFDNIPAPIIYVRGDQSAAVVPYEIFGRPTTQVTVRRLGVTSAPITLNVTDATPAFFTINERGTGQASALNENSTRNTDSNPVRRGIGVIQLFGTGEGQTIPGGVTGAITAGSLPLPTLRTQPVTATVAGIPATVEYAGPAPGLVAGVLQMNIRIPAGAPVGQQEVVVRIGNAQSQAVTVAIGN